MRERSTPGAVVVEIAAFVTWCGPHRLLIRAEHVRAIAALSELGVPAVDVGALFGTPGTRTAEERAILVGENGLWLWVGAGLRMRRVASQAFQPLPNWLPRLSTHVPVSTLVALDGGYAYELDVPRVILGARGPENG